MASTLKTNAIEPEGATTNLVIGESGQNTVCLLYTSDAADE